MKMTVSASSEPNKNTPLLMAWMFIVIGGAMTVWMSWSVVNVIRARNWVETPCVILASSIKTHADGDAATYWVSISYRYEIDGKKFIGNRYQFMCISGGAYQSKVKIVANLPVGLRTVCYVNPADRHESVLLRGMTANMGYAAIPLMFALIGAAQLANRRREGKRWRLPTPVLSGCIAIFFGATVLGIFLGIAGTRPVKINGSVGSWWLIVSGMSFFIIIGGWSIIHYFRQLKPLTVIAGTQVLRESATGKLWVLLIIIMLFFNFLCYQIGLEDGFSSKTWLLFAAALLANFICSFIIYSRFKSEPRLTLRDGDLHAGSRLDLEWDFERSERVEQLSFSLQGMYKDYDQKYPDTFADHPLLLNITDPKQLRHGTLTFNLPTDLRPTSRDADGQVAWKIVAKITTGARLLSTTKREYPVTISGAG